MDYNEGLVEKVINNEYDYSNVIVDQNSVLALTKYIDDVYRKMMNIFAEDEKKNEQLKWEFKNYDYEKGYTKLEFNIRNKNYGNITCESYDALLSATKEKSLNNVSSFDIRMTLDYSKGKTDSPIRINNGFDISFKPYEIRFVRKSNYNEVFMKQIEDGIVNILNQFNTINTIFCTKDEVL